jgi:nitrous oxidase accessory protein NosD
MEYVDGTDLKTLLATKGPPAPAVAADYAHQAAEALAHAHGQGLVHRDLKPSNLLLTPDGRVKLLDLGLARFLQDQVGDASVTREGVGVGTPDYAAPEQFRDARHVDPRADIYALGCTLYHLLAGRVPFPGSSLSEKCRAHEQQEPTPLAEVCPEIPAGLALAVSRMMAKRPQDRFQTAQEVAEALAPYVAASSPSFAGIRHTSSWSGSQLTVTDSGRRRHLLPWALAGAGVAGALVTALFSLLLWASVGSFREQPAPGSVAAVSPGDTGKQPPPAKEESGPAVPDAPNLLTVSQDPRDGGKYQTIGAALEQARPGMTVRVLDAKTYPEVLTVTQASRRAGITLEAPHRATLAPGNKRVGLTILNVPGVTVRGFRLRPGPDTAFLICVLSQSPGVVLEDLEFLARPTTVGVSVEALAADRTDAPVMVRRCSFRGAQKGVQVSGRSNVGNPTPCGRVLVQNNDLQNCEFGVYVVGAVHDLHVVGNRIEGCPSSGVFLTDVYEGTRDILIANNTFVENRRGLRFFDDLRKTDRGERIAVRNNLFLACQSDLVFFDSGGTRDKTQGDGDGAALLEVWQIDHNAREADPSTQGKGWIPAGTGDVVRPHLDGVSRKPDAPDYLRPDADSPLATAGAGTADPSLPRYVGALPPRGVEPWDWERTWRMPRDAKLLTVSKDPADKADYETLGAALAAAKPWTTLRVLDRGTYVEALSIDQVAQQEGICLEAVQGATLAMPPGAPFAVRIRDVPHVRLEGFRLRNPTPNGGGGALPLVQVTGKAQGVALRHLHFQLLNDFIGPVTFDKILVPEDGAPVVLAHCVVEGDSARRQDGIVVTGSPSGGGTRGVCVRDNRVSGTYRGIVIQGSVASVQVTGNLVSDCSQVGCQIEDLAPTSDRVVLANNSIIGNRDCAIRIWDNRHVERRKGQVEVTNNLLLEARLGDLAYLFKGEGDPDGGEALFKLWSCHHNWRDCAGQRANWTLPLAPGDRQVTLSDLASSDSRQPEKVRPRKNSPLATQGAGGVDPSLPTYVGALPPEGVEPWDWSRTWNARARRGAVTSSPDE